MSVPVGRLCLRAIFACYLHRASLMSSGLVTQITFIGAFTGGSCWEGRGVETEEGLRALQEQVCMGQGRSQLCSAPGSLLGFYVCVCVRVCICTQISSQTEHDARARKMLAHQAYTLKSALRDSRSHLRQNTEAVRRHNMEVGAWM